jgi:UrcA family protein
MMRHSLFLAIAASAVLTPVAATAADTPLSVRVPYHDLNLATETGRARFDRRIASAVKRVCPMPDIRDIPGVERSLKCAEETHARMKPVIAAAVKAQGVALAARPAVNVAAQ